jgi:hypothetical protein
VKKKRLLCLSLVLLILGLATFLFVIYGPRDYLLHLPHYLQTVFHPYVLILGAELLLALSAAVFAIWLLVGDDSKN